MENKENNNPLELKEDIDSNKAIDILDDLNGIKSIKLWKKITLFLTGCIGISILAVFAGLIFYFVPMGEVEKDGAVSFVTYTALILSLAAILNTDIFKLKIDLSKWKNWLIGIGIGAAMIIFPIIYTTIVSTFYEYHINGNEESLRDIIDVYPVASVLIFGIVGPVCEELTYRVGLFGALSKKKWVAYLVSIIIFAMVHFTFTADNIYDELVNLPVYVASGALLAFAYDQFGLAASLSAHITNNLYAVLVSIIGKYL